MNLAQDLSHFLSDEARSRHVSPLKDAFMRMRGLPILSLGGGLPLPSLFPFDNVGCKTLAPPFSQGIDQDIQTAKEPMDVVVPKAPGKSEFRDVEAAVSLQYGTSEGDVRLREFVKDHIAPIHKIPYSNWDIVLTVGNTYAWDACLRTFTNRGDVILTEEYSFSSALETARANGLKTVGVPVDLEGIVPEAFEKLMAQWVGPKPKLLYTIPTGQNPTGSCVSAERRQAIYNICQKYDLLLIEDEPYYYLQMPHYTKNHPPAENEELDRESFLKSLVPSYLNFDTDGRVLRLDSFSKILAPGVRLGFIVAQEPFLERLGRLFETSVQAPSGFSQSIVNGLLQRWGQDGYINWLMELRKQYTAKRDLTCDKINEYMDPTKFKFNPPVAGMFFWLQLDSRNHPRFNELGGDPVRVAECFYDECIEYGVQLVPGHWFYATDRTDPPQPELGVTEEKQYAIYVRGTFASVPNDKLDAAIKMFAQLVQKTF